MDLASQNGSTPSPSFYSGKSGNSHDRWHEFEDPALDDILTSARDPGNRLPTNSASYGVIALALAVAPVFRLRTFVVKSCANTAYTVVPEYGPAGFEWISSSPPICFSLALIVGIPTPVDIPFTLRPARAANRPHQLSLIMRRM
jgi:hypothetical protein